MNPARTHSDPAVVRLAAALARLGDDADSVAASLDAAGIRGAVSNCRWCPVAQWLRSRGYTHAALTHDELVCREAGDTFPLSVRLDELQNGAALRDFASRFDAGHYPKLIRHKRTQ